MELQITKLRAPLSVQFELTYECNNYCSFCYNVWKDTGHEYIEREPRAMSFEQICAILEQLTAAGVFQVHFTGGEPTLHPDFLKILRYASAKGLRPTFGTNGNLITPEFAGQLARIGAGQCQVSLHGSSASMHDSLTRVSGSFRKATEGIRHLAEQAIRVNVNMTVNRQNRDDLFATAQLVKELGAMSFSFTRFIYSGAGQTRQASLGLRREDQDSLVEVLARIESELGMRTRVLTPIPYCSLREPEKIVGGMSKCDGGITWCVISPSGQVRTCTNAVEVAGDLHEHTLEEIWRDSPSFQRCQNLEHIPDLCRQCEAFIYCGGGCRSCAANAAGGDCTAPDPCSLPSNVHQVNARMGRMREAVARRTESRFSPQSSLRDDPGTVFPKLSGALMVRKEEFGLLASNGRQFVMVNETGLTILQQFTGQKSLAEIIAHFAAQFPELPPEEIKSKILDFTANAVLMRMVHWSQTG